MATDSNALSESALQDLAERIEAADGPDREIDREIMLAVGYRYEQRDIGCRYEDGSVALDWVYVDPVTDKWRSTHPLEFTASLDAAMTLYRRRPPIIPACPRKVAAQALKAIAQEWTFGAVIRDTLKQGHDAASLRARHPKG